MEMTFNEMLGMLSLVGLLLAFVSGFPISFTMMFIGLAFGYLGIGKLVFHLMNIQFYQLKFRRCGTIELKDVHLNKFK